MGLEKDVRRALRRKAFGCTRPLPPQLESQFDLGSLKETLIADNIAKGVFPGRWTDEPDDDLTDYLEIR
jgi:hypothetical protein